MSLVEQLVAIVGGIITIVAGGITVATALARIVRRRRTRAASAARLAATTSDAPPRRGVRQDPSRSRRRQIAPGHYVGEREPERDEATESPDGPNRSAITARDEILVAVRAILSRSGRSEFELADVLAEMRRRGSGYTESTIRTHVTSRMCVMFASSKPSGRPVKIEATRNDVPAEGGEHDLVAAE
jgi:hypothetical protein